MCHVWQACHPHIVVDSIERDLVVRRCRVLCFGEGCRGRPWTSIHNEGLRTEDPRPFLDRLRCRFGNRKPFGFADLALDPRLWTSDLGLLTFDLVCGWVGADDLYTHRSVDLSIELSIYLSMYLSIDLSIYLFIDLSIYLFLYMTHCLHF